MFAFDSQTFYKTKHEWRANFETATIKRCTQIIIRCLSCLLAWVVVVVVVIRNRRFKWSVCQCCCHYSCFFFNRFSCHDKLYFYAVHVRFDTLLNIKVLFSNSMIWKMDSIQMDCMNQHLEKTEFPTTQSIIMNVAVRSFLSSAIFVCWCCCCCGCSPLRKMFISLKS